MEAEKGHILRQAEDFARSVHENDASGHDWWHVKRVSRLARMLAVFEGANAYLCELAALLHDLVDEKLNDSKENAIARLERWMKQAGVDRDDQAHILSIIVNMSYAGGTGAEMTTLEAKIVQDADRLDALGAIGIARTFAYSGWKGQKIYDPSIMPREQMTRDEYRKGESTAINHFDEKLFKLKDLMNTDAARLLAEGRHQGMQYFRKAFDTEWELGNEAYLRESPIYRGKVSRVHVAFDASTAGSLRIILRSRPDELVIVLDDNLMVGPMPDDERLYETFSERTRWFSERYRGLSSDEWKLIQLEAAIRWKAWPEQLTSVPCLIWAGDSAKELLGLRRLLSRLSGHPELYRVNATKVLQEQNPDIRYKNTGEITPCQLKNALDLPDGIVRLSAEDQEHDRQDWLRLLGENGTLRILHNGELVTVPESYYDEEILKAVYRVEARCGYFRKSARVVGEVIGSAEIDTGDSFIEYRVRHLIKEGVLLYEGSLDAMRNYSVSLVESGPPEQQTESYRHLARIVKLRTLLGELAEIKLREKGIVEQLKGIDWQDLGLSDLPADSADAGLPALVQQLMDTQQPHDRNRGQLIEKLAQAMQAMIEEIEDK
ncbi:DUF3658 domain-containing protein [Paenibacillus ihbetae]|uniref:Phosphohydrolase n=1 Tax=Paenibacillus ihbetae TaxID=1870820 RepID=A0A1B2DTY0_9BACL|nr:DUF3658 domain-containing protein [Paenibacillus ihbetae]ANY71161.1 phosphohydrolase [Paenibacillus ihbetae]OOC61466.1 phosphohydrolase [Paenibacillus ihbetae]